MINIVGVIVGLLILLFFGLRTANDFGFKFVPKVTLPFGEFSKGEKVNYGGGKGGSATVNGNGTAIGGPGGGGGPYGPGGDGGEALVIGDGFAAGGEGGEAGQIDRGGRGGRSGYEAAGLPNYQLPDGTWIYDYGRGGDGANPITSTDTATK